VPGFFLPTAPGFMLRNPATCVTFRFLPTNQGATMEHYQFFKINRFDAKVGLAFVDRGFRFYFPAQGKTSNLKPRNPERRQMHMAMIRWAGQDGGILWVEGFRAGKGRPYSATPYPSYTQFRDFFPVPKAGKFAYWLYCNGSGDLPFAKSQQFTPEERVGRLATMLGLVPTTNARPVSVRFAKPTH
jgi:hypothetical protein